MPLVPTPDPTPCFDARTPRITTSDGVALHLTDSGPGAGPAVVLVAGFTAPAAGWALQVDALVVAGHRTAAWTAARTGCPTPRLRPPHGPPRRGPARRAHRPRPPRRGAGRRVDGASTIWAHLDLFGTAGVRGVVSVDQTPKMIDDGFLRDL